jgi:FAD synthetase
LKLKEKFQRYSLGLKQALQSLKIKENLNGKLSLKISEVVSLAECYWKDASHFHGRGETVTALISLAYGEGLLDALRILGYVEFKWSGEIGGRQT